MISTLENTTASQIGAKLRDLREEDGLISLNRVATLVIVTHTGSLDEPIQAAVRASQEHPARIIVIRPSTTRIAMPSMRKSGWVRMPARARSSFCARTDA